MNDQGAVYRAYDVPIEPFYEKIPRLEREIMAMVKALGERDGEISRLREALGRVAVETTGEVRERALRALGRRGSDTRRNPET